MEAITGVQNDMPYLRVLGSKHGWESASDDIFDAVENAFVQFVRKGRPLQEGDDAHDTISEIAWEAVTYLDKIAYYRIELDKLITEKCAELVTRSVRRNCKAKRRARNRDTV